MKVIIPAFLSALPLALSACGELQGPVTPSLESKSARVVPAVAVNAIYSNFGPNFAFDPNPTHGWTINGFLGPAIGQQAIAEQFTPSADYRFSDAEVAVTRWQGPDRLRVFLQADADGLPGAVIEEIDLEGLTLLTPTIMTANSVLLPILRQGTPYWLTVAAGADGLIAGWHWNSIGDVSSPTHAAAGTQGGGPAGPWAANISGVIRSAFQINGTLLTPQAAIELLMEDVQSLVVAGDVKEGQAKGLTAKLTAAIQSLNTARTGAACNQLEAFVRQVEAFAKAHQISEVRKEGLIDLAQIARSLAGCAG